MRTKILDKYRGGGLKHARELEGFMLLVMGMQANPDLPEFNWNTGLKVLS